jgi:hypothetical protein
VTEGLRRKLRPFVFEETAVTKQFGLASMLLIGTMAAGITRGETPEKADESIATLCLQVYVRITMTGDRGDGTGEKPYAYASDSREDCRIFVERYAKFADAIKAVLKKFPDGKTPEFAEAKKLYVAADGAAQEYQSVLDSNVLPETGRIHEEKDWVKIRPALIRGSNHETEIENIVMKWTYERLGASVLFEPRKLIPTGGH